MGIQHKIIPEYRVVVIFHVGFVSDEEMVSFYTGMFKNSQVSGYSFFIDISTSTSGPSRSSESIQNVAEFGKRWRLVNRYSSKIAFVAPTDISYGLTRMYQGFAEEPDNYFRVFRDAEKALDWLKIPKAVFEKVRDSIIANCEPYCSDDGGELRGQKTGKAC